MRSASVRPDGAGGVSPLDSLRGNAPSAAAFAFSFSAFAFCAFFSAAAFSALAAAAALVLSWLNTRLGPFCSMIIAFLSRLATVSVGCAPWSSHFLMLGASSCVSFFSGLYQPRNCAGTGACAESAQGSRPRREKHARAPRVRRAVGQRDGTRRHACAAQQRQGRRDGTCDAARDVACSTHGAARPA